MQYTINHPQCILATKNKHQPFKLERSGGGRDECECRRCVGKNVVDANRYYALYNRLASAMA